MLIICITVNRRSSQKVLAWPGTLTWTLPVYIFRLEQGENLEENQRNLLQITERFFQAIIGSSSEFPPQLRSVCHCLYQVGLPLSIMGSPQLLTQPFRPHLCGQHHVHILHEVSWCCSTCCSKHHTHQLHIPVRLHPVSVSQFLEALWDAELLSDSQTGPTSLAFAIITVKFLGEKCKINTEVSSVSDQHLVYLKYKGILDPSFSSQSVFQQVPVAEKDLWIVQIGHREQRASYVRHLVGNKKNPILLKYLAASRCSSTTSKYTITKHKTKISNNLNPRMVFFRNVKNRDLNLPTKAGKTRFCLQNQFKATNMGALDNIVPDHTAVIFLSKLWSHLIVCIGRDTVGSDE